MNDLVRRLQSACVGGCTCLTKTPELHHHKATCHYRLFAEAAAELDRVTRDCDAKTTRMWALGAKLDQIEEILRKK